MTGAEPPAFQGSIRGWCPGWEREGKAWGCEQGKKLGPGKSADRRLRELEWGQEERKEGGRLWGEEEVLAMASMLRIKSKEHN